MKSYEMYVKNEKFTEFQLYTRIAVFFSSSSGHEIMKCFQNLVNITFCGGKKIVNIMK